MFVATPCVEVKRLWYGVLLFGSFIVLLSNRPKVSETICWSLEKMKVTQFQDLHEKRRFFSPTLLGQSSFVWLTVEAPDGAEPL